jgi:hypothetical protein
LVAGLDRAVADVAALDVDLLALQLDGDGNLLLLDRLAQLHLAELGLALLDVQPLLGHRDADLTLGRLALGALEGLGSLPLGAVVRVGLVRVAVAGAVRVGVLVLMLSIAACAHAYLLRRSPGAVAGVAGNRAPPISHTVCHGRRRVGQRGEALRSPLSTDAGTGRQAGRGAEGRSPAQPSGWRRA